MLEADDRANELYWGSDRSVNQIAEELDLSKGALYGLIRPLPAAMGCPACGAEVVYPNRTAQERGVVDCAACGWDGTEDETVPGYAPRAVTDERSLERSRARGRALSRDDLASGAVLGGALLGAAAAVGLLLWARRK
ncbi:MAG TPA: hypothetical protein VMM35_06865 [Longimicrobiales bacterium]|nr:hypothetical protein [Longimicrobiales bacterium]